MDVGTLGDTPRAQPDESTDRTVAGDAITAFGAELFRAVATASGDNENVVISPTSVAIALAMLEPGAVADAQAQLRALLRITDADEFHASMNALEQSLESRKAERRGSEGDPGEITMRVANAVYLQEGYPFKDAYLDTVARHYGPVLHAVDFAADPNTVAEEINRFVAEATKDRITDVVGEDVLSTDTVLALVNALYLKASWLEVFDKARTKDAPFTRLDGSKVTIPLMDGSSDSSAKGEGWVAATKSYVSGLSAQFILPDEGRFDAVAADIANIVSQFDELRSSGSRLAVPRFETRFATELKEALNALGLTAMYDEGNLLGIADDRKLVVDKAIHETFVAMDEEGTEAAAATVITVTATGAPSRPSAPVVLDRPFLFRIFDAQTNATLFLGRVLDPTA